MSRSCSVQLTLGLDAPFTARKLVCLLLPQWGLDDEVLVADAALVVSELVTNAFVHGDGTEGTVTLGIEAGAELVLWAADSSSGVPLQRNAGADAESGRGLQLLSGLAHRWDVEQTTGGKRIVATLRVDARRLA